MRSHIVSARTAVQRRKTIPADFLEQVIIGKTFSLGVRDVEGTEQIQRPSATFDNCGCYFGCGVSGRWEARTTAIALRASYEAFSSVMVSACLELVKRREIFPTGNFLGSDLSDFGTS